MGKIFASMAAIAVLVFLSPMIGVLLGAFCGYVVSLFAPVWVPTGLALIGIKATASDLVPLGAALGFLGGFIRQVKS